MNKNPKIDHYLVEGCGRCPLGGTVDCKVHLWYRPLEALRQLILESGLSEELKWGQPCYTLDGKNVVMLGSFKYSCVLSFFKGALLKDDQRWLEAPGKHSQSVRYLRFTGAHEVFLKESIIRALLQQAIELEKAGAVVEFKKIPEPYPDELSARFVALPGFKIAFEKLTPGRQRGYLLHFSSAKQSATRASRIEKCLPRILDGLGLHD